MTIRRRLTVLVTIALAVTMAAFAWLLVRTTRRELHHQLGEAVIGAAARDTPIRSGRTRTRLEEQQDKGVKVADDTGGPTRRGPIASNGNRPTTSTDSGVSGGRRVARFLYSPTGDLIDFELSGFPDKPDPMVLLPKVGSVGQKAMVDRLEIRPSVDGTIRYTVMTRVVRDGRVRFDAISMETADAAVRRLALFALLGGGLVTVAASALTALMIRRTLRPVDEMVATSERIASGDLTARATTTGSETEIGRLGGAINSMLGTIEVAIEERDAKDFELRRFIADASHELRTPITVVRGYSDLYRSGALASKPELDKAMDRIDTQTERMSRLVQDLLLLANLERPDFIKRTRTDLAELASESISEFSMLTPDYPATLNVESPAFADVDGQRIRQVFDNLLRNVREHTKPGTKVAVAVAATGSSVRVQVHNTGPGIKAEDLEQLFNRFWRADATRGQSTGSSGLGLAITESIVNAHGGTINVSSNDEDGTTFTFELPKQYSMA